MASRGRHGGAPAHEDEPRRDERAEQQAPTPQGPVLPPPPPVDYGVFMQGLVQVMQMQAHTQAALQPQLEAQIGGRDGAIPGIKESFAEEASDNFPMARQEENGVPDTAAIRGSRQFSGTFCTFPWCEERVSPLREDTRWFRVLGVQRGVPAPAVAAAVPATGRPGRPRAPARVFALAREDAEQAEHVTEGTVLLLGVHARVLFDTGVTHSFISERFARQLALESGVESEDLEVPFSVHTPVGTVLTRKCIPSLPVCIEDRVLDGCFFLLKMKDYDAILGLDWLEEHYALVDCRRKRIVFRIPGEDEFSHPLPRNVAGKMVISAMKAMRMVNKGCEDGSLKSMI
ncbi:hypothetical protein Taro_024154 [Colocasia esculenta]|uniref:Uncharacterized protein n=1 Tax=Colocasia esculenta TaxID=4460 RepID=A0A843V628_COLES|nr:hypothetical protein [Colocasia esculenta]